MTKPGPAGGVSKTEARLGKEKKGKEIRLLSKQEKSETTQGQQHYADQQGLRRKKTDGVMGEIAGSIIEYEKWVEPTRKT